MTGAEFIVEWSRTRVVFGAGALERLGTELDTLDTRRRPACDDGQARRDDRECAGELGDRFAGVCDIAAMHVPADRVQRAVAEVDRIRPDALLAVGGGSAIGLAKAIARERPLPIVAVPTTYAGSEMTSIWGITSGDTKTTGRDPAVAPRLVIYDPVLTLSLPAHTSAASGMNAMAHAVEAMYAPDASPIASAAAEEAIRTLARALPSVVADSARSGRTNACIARRPLRPQWRSNWRRWDCITSCVMYLAASACRTRQLTPRCCRTWSPSTAPAAPEAMARIADALGVTDAAAGLRALNDTLGLTMSLGALGLKPDRCRARRRRRRVCDVPESPQRQRPAPSASCYSKLSSPAGVYGRSTHRRHGPAWY